MIDYSKFNHILVIIITKCSISFHFREAFIVFNITHVFINIVAMNLIADQKIKMDECE